MRTMVLFSGRTVNIADMCETSDHLFVGVIWVINFLGLMTMTFSTHFMKTKTKAIHISLWRACILCTENV